MNKNEKKQYGNIVPPTISELWHEVFGDGLEFIEAFYRSFETSGNVFTASKQPHFADGVSYSADGFADARDVVGMLNRVPVKLKYGGNLYQGGYIYAACVNIAWRGRGIFKRLMEMAGEGMDFTILIPESDGLFALYQRLGYKEATHTPYPFTADISALSRLKTRQFDGNYDALYAIYIKNLSDTAFIKHQPFFKLSVEYFALRGSIYYTMSADGERCGYVIYEQMNKNFIKIYNLDCPYALKAGIINNRENKRKGMFCAHRDFGKDFVPPEINLFGEG